MALHALAFFIINSFAGKPIFVIKCVFALRFFVNNSHEFDKQKHLLLNNVLFTTKTVMV